MNKKYRIGMYGGKFMPFHKGHNYCVEFAARECEMVYVILFYGCADEEKILKEHPEWWLSLEEREKQMLKICDKNAHFATIIPCLIDVIRLRTADGEEDWDAETPLVRNILGNQLAFKYFRIIQHIMSQKTHYSHSIVDTENPYSFSFGYNLDAANAPYYLIADFAPIGIEYDEYIDPSTLNGSNWMSGVSGDRLLNEINIPGTHDSLCKNVWCAHWLGSKFEYGAITQNLDLEDQLNAGVRLLDIRLTNESNGLNQYDPNGLRLCHGSYKTLGLDLLYFLLNDDNYVISFYNVMSAIIDFLRMHPSETIIITLKSEYDNKTSDGFCS